MVISGIKLSHLDNETHLQFHRTNQTELSSRPAVVNIVANVIGLYNTAVELEAKLVDAERSSKYTEKIAEADRKRDKFVVGLSLAVNSMLRHPDPATVEAAETVSLRLKAFRTSIENKRYEAESSAVQILLVDLKSTFAAEVVTLGIGSWVDGLSIAETEFDELFGKRNSEWADRPGEKLRDVRKRVDDLYREMVTLIDAYGALNGYDVTDEYVRKMNVVIKYYNDHIPHSRKKDLDAADINDVPDQIYEGKPVTPLPVVYYEGEELVFTVDYELSYHDNNRPGTAKITVHGKGKYKGIKDVSFKILGMVNGN
jgi:hypothetical protein